MNNLEMNLFDLASEDLVNEDLVNEELSDEEFTPWFYGYTYGEEKAWEEYKKTQDLYGDGSVKAEIDTCWEEYEEYLKEKYFWKTEDDLWWDRWGHEFDLMEYVYDMTEWDIDELEDYIHLCELCGIHVETETAEDVLAVWKEMERFWNGDDYDEELLAEADVEEKPTRTRAERRKNTFKAKVRRADILRDKKFDPELCKKYLDQGRKLSEIYGKSKWKKIHEDSGIARRNPNLSGKGNSYRKVRGFLD